MSNPSGEDRSLVAVAAQWAVRVITVSAEMVIPGLLGLWVDSLVGTRFAFGIAGFLFGMVLGMWHLLKMASKS